eukprot:g20093.t1
MKTRILATAAAMLCLGFAAIAAAQENPVEKREQMMKQIAQASGAMRAIAKGEKPYDAEVVKSALTTVSTNIKAFPDQFPPGSEGNSEAAPAIWDNMEDFRAKAAKLGSDADALLASMPADTAGVQKAVQTLGSNCGSCHETYRLKKPMARSWPKILLAGCGLIAAGALAGWAITRPSPQPDSHWADLGPADPAHGEQLFWAAGCAGCHAAAGAEGEAAKIMSGGRPLPSPFGTFHVPNISPDPRAGIGDWTLAQFGNAMTRGVGLKGEHLYPSFPYGSYARMPAKDINDLFAYLKTLPPSSAVAPPHELGFPFNIRMAVGGWKLLYFNDQPRVALATADDKVKRGQYLVEGPGHCGECHTPRNALGGFESDRWLAGGPNPEGKGTIPNITPGGDIGSWSEAEIVEYLQTGFTPEFDSVGGSMVEVQRNIAHLPKADIEAIAAYLKAVPSR